MSRRILVTSALPYANGHIHIGHMVEYLQTDIWVRFQKSQDNECRYFCADDTHGTAIMLRARQEGRPETEVIAEMSAAHQRDFADFGVEFDHYGSTNSDSNRALCDEFWQALRAANLVAERSISQLYDTQEGIFLADRFVKGTCPKCGEPDQYGDNCEKCGSTYSPAELLNPISTISGTTPELRSAKHLFVELEKKHSFLDQWTQADKHLQPEFSNYLRNFFLNEPLKDWDISRPAPYFGFEIPDSPGHFWYVWFDAPIGYLASTKDWCESTGQDFDKWWKSPETEIVHFIGKDIVYFHTLFWPAMLDTAGYSLPKRVQVHGFLTVNGAKMSKRHGTFIPARTYLDNLDPAYLRYYYASKLSAKVDDINLELDDFVTKVNADLVGKVVNLASRSARFVKDTGLSDTYPDDGGLFAQASAKGEEIAQAYEAFEYAKAMRLIMALADRANEYIDREQPWALKKQAGQEKRVQDISTICLNLYKQLVVYLSPVLPELARKSSDLLGADVQRWTSAGEHLLGRQIGTFKHLMQRVDPKAVEQMVESSRVEGPAEPTKGDFQDDGSALEAEPLADECTIDDFQKVDLRVARVISAEPVKEAKKLLKLELSLGGEVRRTVFAGIKSAYQAESLVGRLVVMVANLKPRKMKFGTSEGMVIAAGPGKDEIYVLGPDEGAVPGQRVH